MSNFSYDDFAVLVRSFNLELLDSASLRIVPLSVAPSMAQALKGDVLELLEEGNTFLPLEKDGKTKVGTNVTVQHQSDGYCRLVGHLEAGDETEVTEATAFVLYRTDEDGSDQVLAVASLKEGFEIGEGCYPSFTITTVNNYQSVAFNPNAFATMEDLKNINGLDGLHIAFDQTTGDIKLLDKDGNVIDQANLPIKADVIIADGEEGYKYVKTDIQQDIHAAKAWMPAGETAWESVDAAPYTMQHAALVVGGGARYFVTTQECPVEQNKVIVDGDMYYVSPEALPGETVTVMTEDTSKSLSGTIEAGEEEGSRVFVTTVKYEIQINEEDGKDVIYVEDILHYVGQDNDKTRWEANPSNWDSSQPAMIGEIEETAGDEVVGIAVKVGEETVEDNKVRVFFDVYAIGEEPLIKSISGEDVLWLTMTQENQSEVDLSAQGCSLRYGLEAFVWTVKDPDAVTQGAFFATLNDSLRSLGFHEGDDIALGTNLQNLLAESMNEVDAEDYMHGEDSMGQRETEIAEQRNLAKAELVAWNAQHPALTHNEVAGTRISSAGIDIRNGKILIGDGSHLGNDAVKHFELSTNFDAGTIAEPKETGLSLSVMDASGGYVRRNVLTINDSSYISGAPICMSMLEISDADGLQGEMIRRTACFDCAMSEKDGTVNITITDKRDNSKGFSDVCIVEISPVYIPNEAQPEADETASEMLPALNPVNTVATVSVSDAGNSQLTCTCPQIIDWANSVNLDENGARLFAIVKVY